MPTNLENKINRIATNVTNALDAIAAKGVSVSGADSDDLAALIDYLVKLPALTTPGAAADLRSGKQLIGGNGAIVTGTMPEQAAQTITPGTSDKTISAGRYLTGTQTIKGDANLISANIASGKSIFGVAGSFSGGGKMVSGNFSPSGTSNISHTITHNLGKVPNFAFVVVETGSLSSLLNGQFIYHAHYNGTNWLGLVSGSTYPTINTSQPTTAITAALTNGLGSATSSQITFKASRITSSTTTTTVRYWIGVI